MSPLATLGAFLRRDWTIALSYRLPFALEVFALFFQLALFFYLGRLVDDSTVAAHPGLEKGYFAFVAVGLALLGILQSALTSFAQKLREEQTTGTFEVLMATPVPTPVLIVGSAAYDLLRATASSLALIVLAIAVFGLRPDPELVSLPVIVAALAGSLVFFAAVGVAVAAFTVVFKQGTVLITMVLTGVTLLGGVYFPIEVLPAPIELIAEALPFTWGVDVLRAALLTGEVELGRLALLVGFAAVALPVALAVFAAALARARRAGTLAQY